MQSRAVFDVLFLEFAFVVGNVNRQSRRRSDLPFIHWVFVWVRQGDHVVISRELREVERRDPTRGVNGCFESPFEVWDQPLQFISLG